jgi:hypothetical protein
MRKFGLGTVAKDGDTKDLTQVLQRTIATRPWAAPEQRAKIEGQIRPHFDRARIWPGLLEVYRHITRYPPRSAA